MDGIHRAFTASRASAEARGIAFRFTFLEWWQVWEPHWARRHLDKLCMCRNGDEGDYKLGNVHIATASQNSAEWAENSRKTRKALSVIPSGDSLKKRIQEQELAELLNALRQTGCNVSAAAKLLGITFRAARYLLAKNGLTKATVASLL